MKKNFLIMLFVLTAQAQCLMAQAYKPLSEFSFGTDTLNYLKYNFETRKSQYIGYSLEKIINDYGLEIKNVSYINPPIAKPAKPLTGISISHLTLQESLRRTENKVPKIQFYIEFEPPYADYWVTARAAPLDERERALYVKDKIVKDIKVFIFDPNAIPLPPLPLVPDDLIID